MLYILNHGLNLSLNTSPEYADEFMNSTFEKENQDDLIQSTSNILNNINSFLEKVYNELHIKHPLSKELYGIESRNFKLQTPILMMVSAFIHYLNQQEIDILDDDNFNKIIKVLKKGLANSYLETGFKGSSTRPSILKQTVDTLIELYEA